MDHTSLKARQIKAARALLDWSQDDLANQSGLSVNTIRKLELGYISPRGRTSNAIRRAFENNGLEFLEPDGVRHRPEDITIYQGLDGLQAFFDDVYHFARKNGGELLCVCASEKPYIGPTDCDIHIERMTKIKDTVSAKCILTGDDTKVYCTSYSEYRQLSKHYVNSVPFYVYDDKYAFFVFEADPSPKIIVTRSPVVSQAFRLQFYSMWDKATPLNAIDRPTDARSNKTTGKKIS